MQGGHSRADSLLLLARLVPRTNNYYLVLLKQGAFPVPEPQQGTAEGLGCQAGGTELPVNSTRERDPEQAGSLVFQSLSLAGWGSAGEAHAAQCRG